MGSSRLAWAAAAALAVLTYLRFDSLPMPFPSTLPIGPLDPSKIPKPVPMARGSAYEPNSLLNASSVARLFEGRVWGSESVAVRPGGAGDLVLCDRYGYVWRATKREKRSGGGERDGEGGDEFLLDKRPLAHLGAGRPLGFHFGPRGNLLVCMSGAGLVMLEASAFSSPSSGGEDGKESAAERARVVLLTSAVSKREKNEKHSPILYANDLDVSHRTGVVYFTDSAAIPPLRNAQGFWDTMQAYVLSLAQGEPTGRLLSFDPSTGETAVVAGGLWFANGVALSPDETWAAVVETNSLKVYKIHLEGPRRGEKEVLVDGLPGYPDGVSRAFSNSDPEGPKTSESSRSRQDGFWLALVAPLQPAARLLVPWKLGRLLMAWMPERARPPLKPWGAAARLRLTKGEGGGEEGVEVEGWLLDPTGEALSSTSAVTDAGNDRLFFGNLAGGYVSFIDGASGKIEEAKKGRREEEAKGAGAGAAAGGKGSDKSEL